MTIHVHVCSVACNEFSLHKYAQNSVNEICMPCRCEDDDELQVCACMNWKSVQVYSSA